MTRLLPFAMMTLGLGSLSLMDAFVKTLGADYSVPQITFMRYLLGLVAVLPLVLIARPERPTWSVVRANMTRGVILLCAAVSFFQAIQYLPLALATTLFATAPILIVAMGSLFLGEPITRRSVAAIAIGSVGVAIICVGSLTANDLKIDVSQMTIGLALAFVATTFYAIGVITIRARAQQDHKVMIVLLQTSGSCIVAAPFGFAGWQPIEVGDWGSFIMLGILGTSGFLLLSSALARAAVAKLAPLEYTAFLWASLWGFLFFAELPRATTIGGAFFIIAAGLIIVRQDHTPERIAAEETPPV